MGLGAWTIRVDWIDAFIKIDNDWVDVDIIDMARGCAVKSMDIVTRSLDAWDTNGFGSLDNEKVDWINAVIEIETNWIDVDTIAMDTARAKGKKVM